MNQQTHDFITVLEAKLGIPSLRIQRGGANPGTWMHQKLALKLAAWLSPEFELWVYDRIEELLTTGKTEIKPLSKEETIQQAMRYLQADVESLQEKLQLANTTIQKQAPAATYAIQVLNSNNCYTTTTIAKELGMGAKTLNAKLKEAGIQYKHDDHWVLYHQHQNKGYVQTRTHSYYDQENKQQTSLQTVWTETGRAFIHKKLNPTLAAA